MLEFIAVIHKDADSDYGVSFPDLPGCITAGSTFDEAREMAEEALAFHVKGMIEDRAPVPKPSSLDAVMAARENRAGVAIRVPVDGEGIRPVRASGTIPKNVLDTSDGASSTIDRPFPAARKRSRFVTR